MLKQRILTAIILGPLILWSVIAFSHTALAIEFGIFLTLAAWEWARLSGIHQQAGRVAYAIFVMLGMLALTVLLHSHMNLLTPVLIIVGLWWLAASFVIFIFNKRDNTAIAAMPFSTVVLNLVAGLIILLGAFVALTGLHLHDSTVAGYVFILILFVIIWVADSAAYFTGRAFGKHKLAVHVSPGKTWEGVFGAMVAVLLVAVVVAQYLGDTLSQTIIFIAIALITMVISIVGDLTESLFKRRAGVKDSSQLLPGHGGILDRIDSLVAAAPVFLLGLVLAGF